MSEKPSEFSSFVLRQGLVFLRWCCCALVLSALSALCCRWGRADSRSIGYVCSAVSFSSAFLACLLPERGTVLQRGITGGILSALLILCGAVAKGGLDGSAVLSLASFTLCGCLCAGFFPGRKGNKRNNKSKRLKPTKRTA